MNGTHAKSCISIKSQRLLDPMQFFCFLLSNLGLYICLYAGLASTWSRPWVLVGELGSQMGFVSVFPSHLNCFLVTTWAYGVENPDIRYCVVLRLSSYSNYRIIIILSYQPPSTQP